MPSTFPYFRSDKQMQCIPLTHSRTQSVLRVGRLAVLDPAAVAAIPALLISVLVITGCLPSSRAATAFTQPPTIASFAASFTTISKGGSTVLSWSVTGATNVAIDSTSGPLTG